MSRDNKKNNESTSNDKTIYINRVSKVVKGGRRFNFTAMVVSGDADNNKVGVGFGKANQVPEAIRKASEKARTNMVSTPVVEGTVPHIVTGKFGASKVLLRPASPGTGVIASSTVRSILDAAGYTNVLTKVIGSNNAHNVVKATFDALLQLRSAAAIAKQRGISLEKVFNG